VFVHTGQRERVCVRVCVRGVFSRSLLVGSAPPTITIYIGACVYMVEFLLNLYNIVWIVHIECRIKK